MVREDPTNVKMRDLATQESGRKVSQTENSKCKEKARCVVFLRDAQAGLAGAK